MDIRLYNETMKFVCENPDLSEYLEESKKLNIDSFHTVQDHYLYVSPPIPGETYDYAKNIFSSRYNLAYNQKNNIDPYLSVYDRGFCVSEYDDDFYIRKTMIMKIKKMKFN